MSDSDTIARRQKAAKSAWETRRERGTDTQSEAFRTAQAERNHARFTARQKSAHEIGVSRTDRGESNVQYRAYRALHRFKFRLTLTQITTLVADLDRRGIEATIEQRDQLIRQLFHAAIDALERGGVPVDATPPDAQLRDDSASVDLVFSGHDLAVLSAELERTSMPMNNRERRALARKLLNAAIATL